MVNDYEQIISEFLNKFDKKMDYETDFCKWLKEDDQVGLLVCKLYACICHPEQPACNYADPEKE